MADDLTALLRPELPEAVECGTGDIVVRFPVAAAEMDALAARLAEAVEKWYVDVESDSDTGLVLGMQMARARKSEGEAVGLLREVLDHGDAFDAPFCIAAWEKARAYLARRKEHPVGKAQEVIDG